MSTVRLWDKDMQCLAIQDIPDEPRSPAPQFEVTIKGDGPIRRAVLDVIADQANLYLTIDHYDDDDIARRITAQVTTCGVTERRCECGNNITTTSICGQR